MDKTNVLYIEDFNDSTLMHLRNKFGHRFEFFTGNFDLMNPSTLLDIQKYIHEHDIKMIMATGLGAFYAFHNQSNIPCILINPCLNPAKYKDILGLNSYEISYFEQMSKNWTKPDQNRFIGIFSEHSMYQEKEVFEKIMQIRPLFQERESLLPRPELHTNLWRYFGYSIQIEGEHFLEEEVLAQSFMNAVLIFNITGLLPMEKFKPQEIPEAPKKMYVLVNRRLERVYASVQGGHALAQWILEHPNQTWNNNTLIYLNCRLDHKIEEMKEHGYDFTTWAEPDLNNTITAVACYGDPDLLFTRLKTL